MSTEATQITGVDSGTSPAVVAEPPQADAPVGVENIAAEATATDAAPESEAPAPPEFTIPDTDDDLKGQEYNPHVQSLIQQRQHIRQLSQQLNELKPLETWKPLGELGQPDELRTAYERHQKLFSPVIDPNSQQPLRDERGLQVRTSQPWLEDMEKEAPGFVLRHFDDVLKYEYTDPDTGAKSNLASLYFKDIGLDIGRYEDYLNIDKLLAQNNGVVSPEELEAIDVPLREAYKTLPGSLRQVWKDIPEDERRYHLEGAKERLDARQWREQQEQEKQQAAQQQQQQFQAKLQTDILSDLSTVRTQGLTSLRDSLTKAVQLSADAKVNEAYIDAIVAPLALLLSPDFSDLGGHMLESMGVKLDASFNDALNAFVTARQEHVIAKAYGDNAAAASALKEADGKFARIMAKFHDLALKRAATFGYQAKQIATANGNALAAASAVRAMPGNGSAVEAAGGILPAGMDAYSPQANTYLWNQTQRRGQ